MPYVFLIDAVVARFSSMVVRSKAVECLSLLNDDDICDILPQLVQVSRQRWMCACRCVCVYSPSAYGVGLCCSKYVNDVCTCVFPCVCVCVCVRVCVCVTSSLLLQI